jgi:acetyl esterase/lipase
MPPRALHTLYLWFRPTIEALFTRNLPWAYRWRLLALQPFSLLTYAASTYRYWIRRPFQVEYLPITPNRTLRALVFHGGHPFRAGRPLHVDFHGGAFVGGLPESDAEFCDRLARETGALVVSVSYRHAPAHPYPAAADDAEAALGWLRKHARDRYGADPDLVSVSGFSAGGNLALSAAQSTPGVVKAAVGFYASIDLRLAPGDKPFGPTDAKPGYQADKPTTVMKDPLRFLLPLWDSYPGPVRAANLDNPRMSPVLGKIDQLPDNILLVIPEIDILVHEQTVLIERLKHEAARDKKYVGRKYKAIYEPEGFHGWLECKQSRRPLRKATH